MNLTNITNKQTKQNALLCFVCIDANLVVWTLNYITQSNIITTKIPRCRVYLQK